MGSGKGGGRVGFDLLGGWGGVGEGGAEYVFLGQFLGGTGEFERGGEGVRRDGLDVAVGFGLLRLPDLDEAVRRLALGLALQA